MTGSILLYVGLALVLLGGASLVRPLRFLGITTRRRGALVLGIGLFAVLGGAFYPAPLVRVERHTTRLDDFMPEYQFFETHSIHVSAPVDRTFDAVRKVTAAEIWLFRTFTWIRSPHLGESRESILNAPPDEPILDVALRSGFVSLAETPPREMVLGTVLFSLDERARAWRKGDLVEHFAVLPLSKTAKAAMSFVVEEDASGGSLVRTETRVFATDDAARRRFSPYWRAIHPGSAILRLTWLRAIKRRAEAP